MDSLTWKEFDSVYGARAMHMSSMLSENDLCDLWQENAPLLCGRNEYATYCLLHHFHNVTSTFLGSDECTTALQCITAAKVHSHPFLMHMALTLASGHLKYLTARTTHRYYALMETIHWQIGLRLYRQHLACPKRLDFDATIAGCVGAVFLAFATEKPLAVDAYVKGDRDAMQVIVGPLAAAGGFGSMKQVVGESMGDSLWRKLLRSTDDQLGSFTSHEKGSQGLPLAFVELCEVDTLSHRGNNAYHHILRLLTPLLRLRPGEGYFGKLIAFSGRTWSAFKPLVLARDPRAPLLLSYWFALMARYGQWWIVRRAESECSAIVEYLSKSWNKRIDRLLAFPATFGNEGLDAIWSLLPTYDLGVPVYSEGPTIANATAVLDHWRYKYDWERQQTSINRFFCQYTTTVHIPDSNYTAPVPLHFVHHRSHRADAIPLLFVHGWPESFIVSRPFIERLTDPGDDSEPAFHVVVPDIPGFGLSPAPRTTGFGPTQAGHAFNALMHQLGYPKYVMQSGDVGCIIQRQQASDFPDSVVSYLANLWVEELTAADVERKRLNETSELENQWFAELEDFATHALHFYGGSLAQLQLSYAVTDSPIGLAMFIYQSMGSFRPNYVWSLDEIIDWTMMLLIQGPSGALRMYTEGTSEEFFSRGITFGKQASVSVPTGITRRAYEVGHSTPVDWLHRGANLTMLIEHDAGGHFAAYQDPTLVGDIRQFFGNHSASGTDVFH
ncbi:hypothetical protein LTR49_003369 [Elasticomyces elasticus]|nr:hypothetical protein LTR49_003369 [Elasticomyces elasticus]